MLDLSFNGGRGGQNSASEQRWERVVAKDTMSTSLGVCVRKRNEMLYRKYRASNHMCGEFRKNTIITVMCLAPGFLGVNMIEKR